MFYTTLGLTIDTTCDNTTDSNGYIMSPNYPQQYENNLDCRWTVKAPVEHIITLTIDEFHTSTYPINDKLYIHDGTNIQGLLLRTLSGFESLPFSSTGKAIYLKFSTDTWDTEKGFKIKVDAVGKYILKKQPIVYQK